MPLTKNKFHDIIKKAVGKVSLVITNIETKIDNLNIQLSKENNLVKKIELKGQVIKIYPKLDRLPEAVKEKDKIENKIKKISNLILKLKAILLTLKVITKTIRTLIRILKLKEIILSKNPVFKIILKVINTLFTSEILKEHSKFLDKSLKEFSKVFEKLIKKYTHLTVQIADIGEKPLGNSENFETIISTESEDTNSSTDLSNSEQYISQSTGLVYKLIVEKYGKMLIGRARSIPGDFIAFETAPSSYMTAADLISELKQIINIER